MKRAALSALLISLFLQKCASQSVCSCDISPSNANRRLSSTPIKSRREVQFHPTTTNRGVDYKRPAKASKILTVDKSAAVSEDHCDSEQIHLSFGDDSTSIVVSFTSMEAGTMSRVWYSQVENEVLSNKATFSTGSVFSYSELISVNSYLYAPVMGKQTTSSDSIVVIENSSVWAIDEPTGEHWANYQNIKKVSTGMQAYNNPYAYYNSPLLHTVTLTGLHPGKKYFYRVSGSCVVFHFTVPKQNLPIGSVYPVTFGLVSDVGQTAVSNMSMNALAAMNPIAILMPGDLSYADGWPARWDSFGRLFQSLGAEYPMLTTGGNHEVTSGENWLSWQARYPTPHTGSGSSNPCYWGKVVGPVNVIGICSYAGFFNGSLQYTWLQNYLNTSIDREVTPWVAVISHVPFYCSNNGHWNEGELIRRAMEDMLYEAGVDFFLAGHVHAYERTHAVFNAETDVCGITHFTLGDGGNYENAYVPWRMFDPAMGPATSDGAPAWSAFRESSFGVASLDIVNATHAKYSWHRHACGSPNATMEYIDFDSESCVTVIDNGPNGYIHGIDNSVQNMTTSDEFWLVRPTKATCPNRWKSSPDVSPTSPTSPDSSSSSSAAGLSAITIFMISLIVVLAVLNIVQFYFIMRGSRSSQGDSDLTTKIWDGTSQI